LETKKAELYSENQTLLRDLRKDSKSYKAAVKKKKRTMMKKSNNN